MPDDVPFPSTKNVDIHLTRGMALDGPCGHLATLMPAVRAGCARREVVIARLDHERWGLGRAIALRQMVSAMNGPSAEWNILGYTTIFQAATMQLAMLSPPRLGGRTLVNLRDQLSAASRLDLHERVLNNLGLARVTSSTGSSPTYAPTSSIPAGT